MLKLISDHCKPRLIASGCLILINTLTWASNSTPFTAFPSSPGISLYGLAGNGWTGIGDLMAPIYGQPLNFTYLDPQIYYSAPGEYSASLGIGQRWLASRAGILGAYVFGDYNHSDNGNDFWFVSPGLERLGQTLDFSANLYIPVSTQKIRTGTEFADQAGDFSQITFAGHNQYDMLVNTFDTVGWGGDAEVGMRLPFRNAEFYVGGYYFSPKNSDSLIGGAVRLQIPINNYLSALVSEAYDDQYHNTIKAGLALSFGGRHTGYRFTGDLRERLVEPVQRDLVAVAGGAKSGQPVLQDTQNTGDVALEMTNIAFFVADTTSNSGIQGDGTYENPYVGMSQNNVDDANSEKNQNFYIQSGTYNAIYGSSNPNYIVLNNDQIYGRTNDFRQNAADNDRPLLVFAHGGFEIPDGDVNDSLNGLRLSGSATDGTAGIWVNHVSSLSNQNVEVNTTDVQYFGDGIDLHNSTASTLSVAIYHPLSRITKLFPTTII